MKKAEFESLEKSPGLMLYQVGASWRRQIEAALFTLGLTYGQFLILATVCELTRKKTQISQVELARYCGTNITMTSQILRTLERKGYTERKQRKGDEKSKFPQITKKGEELIEKALPIAQAVDHEFFGKLKSDAQKYVDLSLKLI